MSIDESAVAKAWDEHAERWASLVRSGVDPLRDLFYMPAFFHDFIPDPTGATVADLGCGEGSTTRIISKMGARAIGVDISKKLIAMARTVEAEGTLGIRYEVDSFTSLASLDDQSVDLVLSTMAFMNSPNLEGAMRAAFRILRRNGSMCFSVLHPCFWTRHSSWERDDTGKEKGMLVTEYWNDSPYIDDRFQCVMDGGTTAFLIPRFSYRLEQYVNAAADAGFRIRRFLEPRPHSDLVKKLPTVFDRLHKQVPLFLFVEVAKA